MDLQSFCVQNRKKVHSFQLLQSSLHPTQKMSETFQFGVPVKADVLEDRCFSDYRNMSCKAELNFQDISKNNECFGKKSCFEPFTKFSPFSFSKVVGGFVGSKSQGGSASREPHQVWDVILRQMIDSTCQAHLNNNLQQYFNIEDSVSHTILQQFASVGSSHLDFTSYIFSRPDNFFSKKKSTVNPLSRGDNFCQKKNIQIPENKSLYVSKISTENKANMKGLDISDHLSSPKSYADVAKSHVPSRLESNNFSEMPPRILNSFVMKRRFQAPQCLLRGRENVRRRRNETSSNEHSLTTSSQSLRKSPPSPRSCDEPMAPPKFIPDNFQHTNHTRSSSLHSNKHRVNDPNYQQQQSQLKEYKPCGERRNRSSKFRNYNMRNKERKNIALQVNEDIAYVCNTAKSECQNWRCEHNRTPNVLRNRTEFPSRQERNVNRTCGKSVRLRSPPPRTFIVTRDCKNSSPIIDSPIPKVPDGNNKSPDGINLNFDRQNVSSVGIVASTEENSESLVSSPSTVCSERPHLVSECSVDSEDSCVVFMKEDVVESIISSEDESESGSESGSDCDSDMDSSDLDGDEDDEVDFQYFSPLNPTISMPSDTLEDSFLSVPDRLKNVNKRWSEENGNLSDGIKTPKKVHFANPGHLFRVHLMVHWGFAHREARRGPWEEIGRDRCRFQMRIANAEKELAGILDPEHRRKVWEERMCCTQN